MLLPNRNFEEFAYPFGGQVQGGSGREKRGQNIFVTVCSFFLRGLVRKWGRSKIKILK
jgi:hypothetical protein